jgi:hypothetical protein
MSAIDPIVDMLGSMALDLVRAPRRFVLNPNLNRRIRYETRLLGSFLLIKAYELLVDALRTVTIAPNGESEMQILPMLLCFRRRVCGCPWSIPVVLRLLAVLLVEGLTKPARPHKGRGLT